MELSFRRKVRGDSQTCFQNAQQLGETEKQANKRQRTGKHDSPAPSPSRFHKTRREEGGGKTKPVPSTSPGNVAAGRGRARGVLRVVPVVATQRRISPGQDVRVRGLGSSAPRPPYDLPGCPGNPADLKRKNERASAVFFFPSLVLFLSLSMFLGVPKVGEGPSTDRSGQAGWRADGRPAGDVSVPRRSTLSARFPESSPRRGHLCSAHDGGRSTNRLLDRWLPAPSP